MGIKRSVVEYRKRMKKENRCIDCGKKVIPVYPVRCSYHAKLSLSYKIKKRLNNTFKKNKKRGKNEKTKRGL